MSRGDDLAVRLLQRAEAARRRADEFEEKAALLSSLREPEVVDGEAPVVRFDKEFHSGRIYQYAAILASDGLWYTTGPSAPKGYSWEQLITWLVGDGPEIPTVWVCSEMLRLG